MRRLPIVLALLVLIAAAAAPASAKEGSKFHPAVQSRLGMVATESPAAAEVGARCSSTAATRPTPRPRRCSR